MSITQPRILISAGEPSGDLHGALLVRELKRRWPECEVFGFGGNRMEREGVELWAHADEMAIMGFVEVARHLPFFLRLLRRTRQALRDQPPDIVIPIDYPGFNLRLARYARERSVPVLYYIAPQVWAWHRSRMRELARNAEHIAVVLPFEEQLFREAGAQVTFVGHPLLDSPRTERTRAQFCAAHGLDAERPILALLPGSRQQEIRSHTQLFSDAARLVREQLPEMQPVIAQAAGIGDTAFEGMPWPRVGNAAELLEFAHSALTKSGTSTLECALSLTPMVIAYRMNPLTYRIARRVVDVEHIGLVNLIAEERVAAEYVQDEATPAALADAVAQISRAGPAREQTLRALTSVRSRLAGDARGAAVHVADLVADLLARP